MDNLKEQAILLLKIAKGAEWEYNSAPGFGPWKSSTNTRDPIYLLSKGYHIRLKEVDPYAELKKAFAEGKKLSFRRRNWNKTPHPGKWQEEWVLIMNEPMWTLPPEDYRIEPEPDPYAELKKADQDGKTIQFLVKSAEREVWCDLSSKSWSIITWEYPVERYRIKKDSTKVPLTKKDIGIGCALSLDGGESWNIIHYVSESGVETSKGFWGWNALVFNNSVINYPHHRQPDGTPTLWVPCWTQD